MIDMRQIFCNLEQFLCPQLCEFSIHHLFAYLLCCQIEKAFFPVVVRGVSLNNFQIKPSLQKLLPHQLKSLASMKKVGEDCLLQNSGHNLEKELYYLAQLKVIMKKVVGFIESNFTQYSPQSTPLAQIPGTQIDLQRYLPKNRSFLH